MKDCSLKVNTSRLRRDTMSQNKTAISNLSKAREQFATKIEMPEKFAYSSLLNNIPERIKKIEENVSELNSYIDRKAKDFDKAEKEAEKVAKNLERAFLYGFSYEFGDQMTQGLNSIKIPTEMSEEVNIPPENEEININGKTMTKGQYANFRNVCSGNMEEDVLYRCINPIIPYKKEYEEQAYYADRLLEDHKVKIVINLSDTSSSIDSEGYAKSTYYKELQKLGNVYSHQLKDDGDYKSLEKKQEIVKALRPIAENQGPYAIHCKMGQGRTGIAVMTLECLEGCDYEYIYKDYVTSFQNANIVGHNKFSKSTYNKQFSKAMEGITGKSAEDSKHPKASDWKGIDLEKCAEKYLKDGGMTEEEIKKIKINLSKK